MGRRGTSVRCGPVAIERDGGSRKHLKGSRFKTTFGSWHSVGELKEM